MGSCSDGETRHLTTIPVAQQANLVVSIANMQADQTSLYLHAPHSRFNTNTAGQVKHQLGGLHIPPTTTTRSHASYNNKPAHASTLLQAQSSTVPTPRMYNDMIDIDVHFHLVLKCIFMQNRSLMIRQLGPWCNLPDNASRSRQKCCDKYLRRGILVAKSPR